MPHDSWIEASTPRLTYEDISGLVVPHILWDQLYPYQRTGIAWLFELHQQAVGGILADEMGLGKTVQIVAFLASLPYGVTSDKISDRSHFYANCKPTKMHVEPESCGAILIVCPATVIQQWVKEFHTWWPQFRVCVLHSSVSKSKR